MQPENSIGDKTQEPQLTSSWILFLGFVAFSTYAWHAHLTPDQLIEFCHALGWPITVLIVAGIFKNEIAKLLGRITNIKIAGTELQANQPVLPQGTEPDTNSGPANSMVVNESQEFEQYNTELVLNTRAALVWFANLPHPTTLWNFMIIFALPNPLPVDTNIGQEKVAIFSALQIRSLIESEGQDLYKISQKGIRYLEFLKLHTVVS